MADTKGDSNKPGEPKPGETTLGDTRSGPVKPPVLDLTARDTTTPSTAADTKPAPGKPLAGKLDEKPKADGKPDAKPDSKPPTRPAPATPTPPTPPRTQAAREPGFAFGAALLGAVLGLGAAYGLAWLGYWPQTSAPVATPEADPRLAQFATAIPELETVTQTTQSELATLNQRVATLEAAEPAEAPATTTTPTPAAAAPDLSGIEADIAALAQRIDALDAAPAPTVDTSALTADLAALGTRLDELGARVGTTEASLRTLDTTVAQTSAAVAAQPTNIGAVLQLPLILSGLETAFESGRPFATELAALRSAVPDATIPADLVNAADTGLARPDTIAQRFAEVLPAMLAGRPANPEAQWQDGALDWFRSAIALRPTGELEGDTPEAVMSQLEGAVARRDFAAAEGLLGKLPAPMLAAAGELPAMVGAQADAAQLLETLRQQALAGEATP